MSDHASSSVAADYAQLSREYRNMEQNRRAYTEESQNIIRRQVVAIDKLRRDNETLKAELAMETRSASNSKGGGNSDLNRIQDMGDQFTTKLACEAKNLEELEKAISLLNKKILTQRKLMGGVNAAKENQAMVQKQIRILENRLDKALIKFNEALAHNKHLRENIDNLRRERVVFDNIYRKLEKELHEKKKQMANIIEMSNQAYEARDAAQMEITAIQQQNSTEQEEWEEQMNELNKLIEAEKKRKDMLMQGQSKDVGQRGDMSMEEEAKLKKKVAKGVWSMAKDKANIQVAEMKAQSYEEAFNKIKAATGITDIDELVTNFIQNEEQNFSLFNFVNEQNNDIEKLEEQIHTLHEEEAKYTQESGDDANQHRKLLEDLEQKLQATESAAEKYELKHQDASKTINTLKIGIHSVFTKIDCNTSSMSELLSNAQVTDANIMQFLGIIEQRTNEVLQHWAVYMKKHGDATTKLMSDTLGGPPAVASTPNHLLSILGVGPNTPMGQDQCQINPPNLEDYSSEDSDDDSGTESRPLTKDELKSKTMKTLHRRQQALGKDKGKDKRGRGSARK